MHTSTDRYFGSFYNDLTSRFLLIERRMVLLKNFRLSGNMIISSRCDEALDTYHRINENYHQRRVFIQDIYSKIFQNDNFTNTLIKYKQIIFLKHLMSWGMGQQKAHPTFSLYMRQ